MSPEAFTPVKLRSPDGDLYTAHSAREVNDLVFGHGYTVVGKREIEDVLPSGTADAAKTTPASQPKKETLNG